MPIIPGLDGTSVPLIISQVAYWFGMFLLALLIITAFVVIYYWSSFQISATVFPLYGSSKSGHYSIGKPVKNRIKWIDRRTAWKSMKPLFNRIKREPFAPDNIYPGKKVYIFDDGSNWIPGQIDIEKTENELKAKIKPVPHYVRNWQSLQFKQHEVEFAKMGFWEENKHLIITLGVVLFCCILCGAVIYFTFKYAGGAREDMRLLTNAINNIITSGGGNIPG